MTMNVVPNYLGQGGSKVNEALKGLVTELQGLTFTLLAGAAASTKMDIAAMAVSLETRSPFLDHRVCELAFTISGGRKLRNGRGKFILVETFKDLLPPSLHNRPKWGFEMPLSAWLHNDLGGLIDEHLEPERIRRQGIFDAAAVARVVEAFRSRRSDRSWQLWNLIVFQVWHERYMAGSR